MARDCPIGVQVFCCCCCMHEFSPNLCEGVCVIGVCVLFWAFFECWCVCGMSCFVPKYH